MYVWGRKKRKVDVKLLAASSRRLVLTSCIRLRQLVKGDTKAWPNGHREVRHGLMQVVFEARVISAYQDYPKSIAYQRSRSYKRM
jgi:hypothetical protein